MLHVGIVKGKACFALHQERVSDRLEGERQERALKLYLSQAGELDQWLMGMHATVTSVLEQKPPEEVDNEDQLAECQVRAPPVVRSDHCMQMCGFKLEIELFHLAALFLCS